MLFEGAGLTAPAVDERIDTDRISGFDMGDLPANWPQFARRRRSQEYVEGQIRRPRRFEARDRRD